MPCYVALDKHITVKRGALPSSPLVVSEIQTDSVASAPPLSYPGKSVACYVALDKHITMKRGALPSSPCSVLFFLRYFENL